MVCCVNDPGPTDEGRGHLLNKCQLCSVTQTSMHWNYFAVDFILEAVSRKRSCNQGQNDLFKFPKIQSCSIIESTT